MKTILRKSRTEIWAIFFIFGSVMVFVSTIDIDLEENMQFRVTFHIMLV